MRECDVSAARCTAFGRCTMAHVVTGNPVAVGGGSVGSGESEAVYPLQISLAPQLPYTFRLYSLLP